MSWYHNAVCMLQALLTDLAANAGTVENINKLADQMIAERHKETPYIKARKAEINKK